MARKGVLVEEVLSMLRDIPEDTSECGDEISLDIESDDDEFVPVSSSSETEDERDSNILEHERRTVRYQAVQII